MVYNNHMTYHFFLISSRKVCYNRYVLLLRKDFQFSIFIMQTEKSMINKKRFQLFLLSFFFKYFQFSCQCDKVLTGLLRKHVGNMRPKLR